MVKPAKVNLKIYRGASFYKLVTWKQGDPLTPVDLTGCTARMQVRRSIDSDVVLKTFTTENDTIVLGGEDGTIRYAIMDAEETADFDTDGVYDLEIVFADGTVVRRLYGDVKTSQEVTRS